MMSIGNQFATICLESIKDKKERAKVVGSLENTGHQMIDISFEQMGHFLGNMLELEVIGDRNIIALSQSAFDSLIPKQSAQLEQFCELCPLAIPTIENIGGGSQGV